MAYLCGLVVECNKATASGAVCVVGLNEPKHLADGVSYQGQVGAKLVLADDDRDFEGQEQAEGYFRPFP